MGRRGDEITGLFFALSLRQMAVVNHLPVVFFLFFFWFWFVFCSCGCFVWLVGRLIGLGAFRT